MVVPVLADQVISERIAAWAPVAAEQGIAGGFLEQILDNLIATPWRWPGRNRVTVSATATRHAYRSWWPTAGQG